MILEYVRIDGDACVLTEHGIKLARRVMRERGIESLPIMRGTIHAGDVATGLVLRASVNGVGRPGDGRAYAADADFLCVYCHAVPLLHAGACDACQAAEDAVT